MDYETLIDCFLGVFEHYKTSEVKVFTFGHLRNDLPALIRFLLQNKKNNEWHISFNGLAFDSQITQFILENQQKLIGMSGAEAAHEIYKKAQDCINRSNNNQFQEWSEKQLSIKQIDLFKLNHWDNPAKRSSLKWIQFTMDWDNVQDMPIHHTESIRTVDELKTIASYCRNDVSSTKEIMNRCKKLIKLRGILTNTYNMPLYSASEPKIAKELFLYYLSKKSKIKPYELKQMRTYRDKIHVKDILLPYLESNDVSVFQELLNNFKNLVIDGNQTRNAFKYSIKYRGVESTFGLGGIHGAKKGVYESGDGMIIMSSDVISYYPNLSIRNKWSPAHLPKENFCELYEWFFDERTKIPKSDPNNYFYKIVLNSTFGLSIDKNSFLYDPQLGMCITINGQLSLMMLYTMLAENIPGAVPIMQNTDGLEMIIPKSQKENYLKICKQWENITQLKLEHDEYQKLIVPDVNNYIGIFKFNEVSKIEFEERKLNSPDDLFKKEDDKYYHASTKCKGRFNFKDLALHKNKSFQIIPKAIYNYYVHNIKPEDFLKSNRNIFDYVGGARVKRNWKLVKHQISNGVFQEEELQKTIRFYVSKKGCKLTKINKNDGRKINIVSDEWLQTVYNIHKPKPFEEYQINEQFYLSRIYKEIKSLNPERFDVQTTLF